MKVIIINAKDEAGRKFEVLKKESAIDEASNNEAYVYTDKGDVDKQHLFPFMKESYEMDDYDYFIWSFVGDDKGDTCVNEVKELLGDGVEVEYIVEK